jgi:hypothetical protein
MIKGLLKCASGDNDLSIEERNWVFGYFAAKGMKNEDIAEAERLTPDDLKSETFKGLLQG